MAEAKQVALIVYMQDKTLIGFINNYGERLSDLLNSVSLRRENRGRFIELRDVTIQHSDGREERLKATYINKANIQMAATIDGDLARGIGGQAGAKYYPFVDKLSVPVRVQLPDYTILGNINCVSWGMVRDTIEEKSMFLPLTQVSVCQSENSSWRKLPFAAVNREQIVSLAEQN